MQEYLSLSLSFITTLEMLVITIRQEKDKHIDWEGKN